MQHKECKVCGESKPFSAYYCRSKGPRKGTPSSATCKDCEKAIKKQNYEQNKEKAKQKNKAQYEKHKAKRLSYQRDYREANLEKVKAKDRAYNENNKEKIRATKAAYREKNREKINAYRNRWRKERLKNDPAFRVYENTRKAIYKAIKKQGKVKGGATFSALPYSPQDLVEHLEKQFDDRMTWDNYGSYWEIDHVYPQSLLPYESLTDDNFLLCWSLENLQPLEANENRRKSNKTKEVYDMKIPNIQPVA